MSAKIVVPPPQLHFPFRLFYVVAKFNGNILNRSQPLVALDGHGREIGRTSYTLVGG